jgi:hypothetical protein
MVAGHYYYDYYYDYYYTHTHSPRLSTLKHAPPIHLHPLHHRQPPANQARPALLALVT